MKPHYNVLICTPGRMMEAEYVRSLVTTISHLEKMGISYLYLNEYSSQVNAAREATIMGSRFLHAFATEPVNGQVTYDKIIWIDCLICASKCSYRDHIHDLLLPNGKSHFEQSNQVFS